jgi:hypothetical protein
MACGGALTSMVMTVASSYVGGALAGGGGIPGVTTALQPSAALTNSVSSFLDVPTSGIMENLSASVTSFAGPNAVAAFTEFTSGSTNFIGSLTNALPGDIATQLGNSATKLASSYITGQANVLVGRIGDVVGVDVAMLSRTLNSAETLVAQSNQFLNTASNFESLGTSTFQNIDSQISGGFSNVSKAFPQFGTEFANIGNTINLNNLSTLGNPGALVQNIISSTGKSPLPLLDEIKSVGLDPNRILSAGSGLVAKEQAQLYSALNNITGPALNSVKQTLGVTTPGINTAADLLNPAKLFPTTFNTLTAPIRTASVGFRGIYEPNTDSVNDKFNYLGEELANVIPPDVATACAALARSLGQITNIDRTNPAELGNVIAQLETTNDLPLVSALTKSELDAINAESGLALDVEGTGPGGTLTVSDVVGTAAGYVHVDQYAIINPTITALSDEGALDDLNVILQQMTDLMNGDFTVTTTVTPPDPGPPPVPGEYSYQIIIPSGPGAGTYPGVGLYYTSAQEGQDEVLIDVLIPLGDAEKAAIIAAYPEEVSSTNSAMTAMAQQLLREKNNQAAAGIDLTETSNLSTQARLSFAAQVPDLGKDTSEGGTAWFMEQIANLNSLGGQATVAAMREARNQQRLESIGLSQQAFIPETPPPQPPAQLLPAEFSLDDVKNSIVT